VWLSDHDQKHVRQPKLKKKRKEKKESILNAELSANKRLGNPCRNQKIFLHKSVGLAATVQFIAGIVFLLVFFFVHKVRLFLIIIVAMFPIRPRIAQESESHFMGCHAPSKSFCQCLTGSHTNHT